MKQLKLLIGLFLISLFNLLSARDNCFAERVKGKIIDKSNRQPIEKAHVFIISGEEEALSSSKGSFEITTGQSFPLTIKINHLQYQVSTVTYQNAYDRPVVKLEKK